MSQPLCLSIQVSNSHGKIGLAQLSVRSSPINQLWQRSRADAQTQPGKQEGNVNDVAAPTEVYFNFPRL